MENKKLTVNPLTNQPHTAKWPSIIALIGAILVAGTSLFAEKWTGVGLEKAWPVILLLLGIAGYGGVQMARRA